MNILFVGHTDPANICNRIARAINDYRGDRRARVWTRVAHPLGYQEDMIADVCNYDELISVVEKADWLVSTGDGSLETWKVLREKLPFKPDVKLAMTHAGSAYRNDHVRYNNFDNMVGARLRFIGMDSLHLADGDPKALPYFGTCDPPPPAVASMFIVDGVHKPRVTHTPASPERRALKGTEKILSVLDELAARGIIELDLMEGLPPAEVARRRLEAHIHVDQMSYEVGGFGQSAIEAMGAGCVVLADVHNIYTPAVERHIPRPPIIDVRTKSQLWHTLVALADNPGSLDDARRRTLHWASIWAHPKSVAAYWLGNLARFGG